MKSQSMVTSPTFIALKQDQTNKAPPVSNNIDSIDPDDDNDGYADQIDEFPLDAGEWVDTDSDGIGDNADEDDDDDGVLDEDDAFPTNNAEWNDLDGDGLGSNADTDDDIFKKIWNDD